jgi:hypothetical protein
MLPGYPVPVPCRHRRLCGWRLCHHVSMSEGLTYRDALKILGAADSRLVGLLDAAATGGLGGWAAASMLAGTDATVALGLLQLKDEAVGFGRQVMRRVSEWHSGLSRFSRSERLVAAHAVLVVSSYFEALGAAQLPVPAGRLVFTAAEQVAMAGSESLPDGYTGIVELLAREALPAPDSSSSFAVVCTRVRDCYRRLSDRVLEFTAGMPAWAELDAGRRQHVEEVLREVPARALELYEAGYRDLAADNQEFAIWAGLTELRAVSSGLAGMAVLLSQVAARRPGDRPLAHLLASYRGALQEPVLSGAQADGSMVFPTLAEAYLTPQCRMGEVQPGDDPAAAEWWAGQPLVSDVEIFLAGYLTSLRAARLPLVVLGEPGSGKSKLTEVLAARLADGDFLPVRVELRDVAAESIILEQVEQAVYRGPGERTSWHDLVESAGGAQPVVILDGFDELIQASAVNRYDYLEQVRDFQRRQAQIGHPVAVIVTSRTVVADHARFPAGTLALQLQPFTEEQVRRWLDIWARSNSHALAVRGLRPLPARTALAHPELASQPLLLMLLAIYDATRNALQDSDAHLGSSGLYEGLFSDFALREIAKSAQNRALPAGRQHELAERELQRLAVTAIAMFTRGQQAVTEAELNRDLSVLYPGQATEAGQETGETASLSPAQRATGRFFFIHKSQARSHDELARSYEFLHSTFGEFLVARMTIRVLRHLAAMREVIRQGMPPGTGRLDDGFLHAALSFSCLADRTPILGFLRELLDQLPDSERARCQELLAELLTGSLYPHPNRSFTDYEPVRYPVPRRLAAYSANLVLILVLLTGTVTASQLFGPDDASTRMREYGYLWRGMFTSAEWRGMIDAIRARPNRNNGLVDIELTLEDGSPVSPADSIIVSPSLPAHAATEYDALLTTNGQISFEASIRPASLAGRAFRNIALIPNWHASLLLLQTVPSIRAIGDETRRETEGILGLPGYLLAQLDFTKDAAPDERAALYQHSLDSMGTFPDIVRQLLLRLREDASRFHPNELASLLRAASRTEPDELYISLVNDLWRRLDDTDQKQETIRLITDVHSAWPRIIQLGLDRKLLTAIKTSPGQE